MGIPIDDDEPVVPTDEQPAQAEGAPPAPSADPEAPEPDAAEQSAEVAPGWRMSRVSRQFEVPEADAIDQALEAPLVDPDEE